MDHENIVGSVPPSTANSTASENSQIRKTAPRRISISQPAKSGAMPEARCDMENTSSRDTVEFGKDEVVEKDGVISGSSSDSDAAAAAAADSAPQPNGDGQLAPENQRSKGKTALIMFGLCMATFLAALDITIITTALPTIAAAFDASEADYAWIGSAYLLAAAASTPTWGKISDIFGRKPTILVCNVLFLVGSLLCALAVNVNMLIGSRILQGIAGGGLIVMTQICISDLFSLRNRGMYFGIIGLVWALASALGPLMGGVFTQFVTWRWCFYVNLPCDGAAFIVLLLFLDVKTPKTPFVAGIKAIDWLGSITSIGGVVMLLLGLQFGGVSYPWNSPVVICLIVFGVVTIGIFLVIEQYVPKYPIVPLRILTSRNNIAAIVVCFCHGFVFISSSYFLPYYFQNILGATPLLSGVYSIPYAISLSLVSAATGILIRKTGNYRYPIWFGMLFLTLGFGTYISMLYPTVNWGKIIAFQIIAGIGAGPNFQSPLIALQNGISPRDIASATATFGFVRQLGTSISITVGNVIFQNQAAKYVRESGVAAGAEVVRDSQTHGLRDMYIFYTCFAFLGFVVSLMIKQKDLSKEHSETKTGLEEQEKNRLAEMAERKARKEEKRLSKGTRGRNSTDLMKEVEV